MAKKRQTKSYTEAFCREAVRLSSPDILQVVSSAVHNLGLMVMSHPY
jgi:hypothetical protein